jgi:CDP-paratose 2-epimerase
MSKLVPFRSVLIFGGAGFIGSNWAYRLIRNTDARVHIFDNLSRAGVRDNLAWLQRTVGNSGRLRTTIGDVRDAALVEQAVHGATEIYHFAAQVAVTTSVDDPRLDYEVNVGGTINILEAARKTGRRPFLLFTSTNKVYGHFVSQGLVARAHRYTSSDERGTNESQPLDFCSPYGCSKGAADQYVHDYSRIFGLPTVVFRMSCVAGPHQFGNEDQGWVAHFLFSALQNRAVTIYGDGRQVRDVLYVEDLLRAFESARLHLEKTAGEVYNVGGGIDNSTSLLEIIDEIEHVTGRRLRYSTEGSRPGDQLFYVTDYRKLQQHTGWRPQTDVRATLQNICDWWKENRRLFPEPVPALEIAATRLQEVPGTAL